MEKILVFKTNVNSKEEVEQVAELFEMNNLIKEWSFDLEDSDKVLRVVCDNICPELIEHLLTTTGIYCSNMEY